MKRLGLVRALKGTIIFMAAMAAVCYLEIFPNRIWMAGKMYGMDWMVAPGIVAVSLSAVPIVIALALFWRICTEIGRDNSFCHKNARWLGGIGLCAMVDTGYCAVGTVTIELLAGSSLWVLGMAVCVVGVAIAVASFLLSHLVLKAADMKAENDLTI